MSEVVAADLTRLSNSEDGRLDIGGVRRHQIVMAVRNVVATEGVKAVTIARIASAMGTSRGVVNYHFKNKEDILRAALQSAVKDASAASDQIVSESNDLGGVTDLVVGLASSDSDWWQLYVAFLAETTHDEFAREMIQELDRTYRTNLTRTLGTQSRAAVVLALMKGLALQRVVDPAFNAEAALDSAKELLAPWQATGAGGNSASRGSQ